MVAPFCLSFPCLSVFLEVAFSAKPFRHQISASGPGDVCALGLPIEMNSSSKWFMTRAKAASDGYQCASFYREAITITTLDRWSERIAWSEKAGRSTLTSSTSSIKRRSAKRSLSWPVFRSSTIVLSRPCSSYLQKHTTFLSVLLCSPVSVLYSTLIASLGTLLLYSGYQFIQDLSTGPLFCGLRPGQISCRKPSFSHGRHPGRGYAPAFHASG